MQTETESPAPLLPPTCGLTCSGPAHLSRRPETWAWTIFRPSMMVYFCSLRGLKPAPWELDWDSSPRGLSLVLHIPGKQCQWAEPASEARASGWGGYLVFLSWSRIFFSISASVRVSSSGHHWSASPVFRMAISTVGRGFSLGWGEGKSASSEQQLERTQKPLSTPCPPADGRLEPGHGRKVQTFPASSSNPSLLSPST